MEISIGQEVTVLAGLTVESRKLITGIVVEKVGTSMFKMETQKGQILLFLLKSIYQTT